jgi:DNA polymerase III subunit alpha
MTRRTQEAIMRQRPFTSLADFLSRADPRPQEAASLARAGALQGFGSIPGLLRQIETGSWRPSQPTLFDFSSAPPADETDWSLEERVEAQEEVLGISVDAHPLELFAGKIAASGAVSTLEAAVRPGTRLRLAGMRQWSRRMRTARGETMMMMTLEDLEGTLDVLFYPEAYRRCRNALNLPGPYIIEGVVERNLESGEPVLRAERAESLRKV